MDTYIKNKEVRTSLEVKTLFSNSKVRVKGWEWRDTGSIPDQGDKIPHASQPKNQNMKQKQ